MLALLQGFVRSRVITLEAAISVTKIQGVGLVPLKFVVK